MNQANRYFGWVDFLVFGAVFLFSAMIGVLFAYKDRQKKTTENYYYGDRRISPIPVAISLSVSCVSATTFIGVPAEVYLYGIVFIWLVVAWCIACTVSGVYYLPLIYRLKLSTINQYLELRFHSGIRKMVSFMVMIHLILFMGITIYLPSLALNAVTPLSLGWAIFLTSAICTFYTSIGGMKAVIWTDVFQGLIMLVGSLAVFIRSVEVVGGWSEVMEAAERGGRDNFIVSNTDLRVRSTTWTILIGTTISWVRVSCCEQVFAQRFLSCSSVKTARIALVLGIIPAVIFNLIGMANGLSLYAYFEGCDPVESRVISKADQSIPLLTVEIFQSIPGLAGLFVSAAYSGTLSTVSSGINSLAVMTLMDFVIPRWPKTSHTKQMVLSKIFSVLFGTLVLGLAYAISMMEANIIGITAVLSGFLAGPVLGVFTMGIFMPWINTKGAFSGTVCGWIFAAWLALASVLVKPLEGTRNTLPLSVENCNLTQTETPFTVLNPDVSMQNIYLDSIEEQKLNLSTDRFEFPDQRPPLYDTLYSVSPFLFTTLGFLSSVAVGIIVSLLTGFSKPSEANPNLFVPMFDNKILPRKVRKFFRFGVPEIADVESPKKSSIEEEIGKYLLDDNLSISTPKTQESEKIN